MNENFENDELLSRLAKSAKTKRPPKLSDELLERAAAKGSKVSPGVRLGLASRFQRFSLAGAVAVAAATALAVALPHSPSTLIELGSSRQSALVTGPMQSSKINSDSMVSGIFMPSMNYFHFVDSANLETPTLDQHIYKSVQNLTQQEILSTLASEFGLNGKITNESAAVSDPSGANTVSPTANVPPVYGIQDGDKYATAYLSADGEPVYFSYTNSSAYTQGPCLVLGKAPAGVDSQGSVDPSGSTQYCQQNATAPDQTPTDAEAKAQAQKLFAALGLNVSDSEIYLTRSEGALSATSYLSAGNQKTNVSWQIDWGNTGEIANFYGTSMSFKDMGTFGTISASEAVSRANLAQWSSTPFPDDPGHPWAMLYPVGLPAIDNTSLNQPDRSITVEVTRAEAAAGSISDGNGTMWIVPSLKLYSDKGYLTTVIAVVDGVIKLPPVATDVPSIQPLTK